MSFYTFVPKLLNMSLTASVAIVFVLLLRLVLKKAPKVISYALWGVVLFRLLCPVSIESGFSLFGLLDAPIAESTDLTTSIEYVPENIVHSEYPAVTLPVPGVSDAINEKLPQGEEQLRADPLEGPIFIATCVWITGVLVMAAYSVLSYRRLRKKLLTASLLRDNIYLADEITSPFVMGLIRPKIYLPSDMEEREQAYIIRHEQHHIRRGDHIVKALAFLALAIHWFNPLVWVAFICSGKDMEMSCDEAVVKKMGTGILADYTASLLSLATGKHIIAGMPLAFGEGNTKGRIRNLANWRKPAFWVVLAAVIACVALAVGLITNPAGCPFDEVSRTIISASHFDVRTSDDAVAVEMNQAQISELSSRLAGVKNTKKSDEYGGFTPGYQISALLEDGSYIRISGYSLSENDMVDIEWNGDRYVVSDSDFQEYLSRICAGEDVPISSESATPDKVKFEAEVIEIHEGYFLVAPEASWALNSTDRIEVPLMNMDPALEPQVGDTIEITCDGEILDSDPARLSKVYSIKVVKETSRLSLNDVIILSRHGYDLSWADFEQFEYTETGSGLYIRVYEINEMYRLWIGGTDPDSDPMYIYLALADDLDTRIDIRDGGVTEFIGADHSEVLLTNAINEAILAENKPSEPDGLYHCASFVLLDTEEICGVAAVGSTENMKMVTAYGLALHQGFGYSGGTFHDAAGSHVAVAIAFEVVDGKYVLREYWTPRDGTYYVQDIRDKFPDEVEDEALDTQKYILDQKQACYDQAIRYGGVDTDSAVEYLFEVIESSPAHSSNPGDYINEHSIEYRELTYYGKYTLRYCFDQFLQGEQTGLHGHLMALACQDIMLSWGEGYAIDQDPITGQDWFDEFLNNAIRLASQSRLYNGVDIRDSYPGAWLLLEMMN